MQQLLQGPAMTVPIQDPIASYIANGVTAGPFTVPFRILVNDDLKVLYNGLLADSSTYVYAGLGDDEGSVTFFTLPPAGTTVIVYRQVALERENDYQFNGDLRAVTVNADFDRIWMAIQDIGSSQTRTLRFPVDEYAHDGTLPEASVRSGKILGFDDLGGITMVPVPASIGAGDLHDELGTDGTPGFKPGVDFTPGVSTTLQLSRPYGTKANLFVDFEGTAQGANTYSLSNLTLAFDGPLPAVTVFVKGGTTLSIYVPPDDSVGDNQLSFGATLVRPVASVAALQNLNILKYQRASTNGYFPGGPGGGDYYYDATYPAANANGFTAIASANGIGCWRLIPRDMVSLYQAGAKGDDTADDTAATQAAVAWCESNGVTLRVPAVSAAFRLTATINHTANFVAKGDGVAVVKTKNFTGNNTHGSGAWFHIDHAGIGFKSIAAGAVNQFSVEWNDIGTVRNQPTPNGSNAFTPNANDYDFYADTTDNTFRNVVVLNPTKAFYSTGGGRQLYYNIKGQPLSEGIHTDTAYDTCRYEHIHFWPWWSEAAGVQNYTKANATAFYSARNDNPMYSNLFAFGYFTGFAFANNANGPTSLAALSNINLDSVAIGVRLDSTCAAATLFFSNLTIQGLFDATQSNSGVWSLPGSNANQIRIDNGAISGFGANDIRLDGTGNYCWAKNMRYGTWGLNNPGLFTAVAVAATCRFESDFPFNAYTAQTVFSGAGAFQVQLAKGCITIPTDGNGHATVVHGASVLPNAAVTTVMNDAGIITAQPVPGSFTTSQFVVRVRDSTGAPLVNSSISLAYDSFFAQ
jgi:hypothetical protein